MKFPAFSTPPFHIWVFSFFLNSVNRFSIRLPPRISDKLENSSPLQSFAIRPGGQGRNQERITASLGNTKLSLGLPAKVAECCVMPPAISPKCEFLGSIKFAIVRFPANVENCLYAVPSDFTISIRRPHNKTAHLFRVSPYPQPIRSVSPSSLSFLILPPLNSGNRFSIRLWLRISAKLENSSPLPAFVLPLGEQITIPICFNNKFGVNVNWDPNK